MFTRSRAASMSSTFATSSRYTGRFLMCPTLRNSPFCEEILRILERLGLAHTAPPILIAVLLCAALSDDHVQNTPLYRPMANIRGAAKLTAIIASFAGRFWSVTTFNAANHGPGKPFGL